MCDKAVTLGEPVTALCSLSPPPDLEYKQTTNRRMSELVQEKTIKTLALCEHHLLIKKNLRELTNDGRGQGRNPGGRQKAEEQNSRTTEPFPSGFKCLNVGQHWGEMDATKKVPSSLSTEQQLQHLLSSR